MITGYGVKPPLHRRFDEDTARGHVRNRYSRMRDQISKQVKALQQDGAFRQICRKYYDRGYPDWVILSAVVNIMLNRRAKELGQEVVALGQDQVESILAQLSDIVYPSNLFAEAELDFHIGMHFATALQTYGFTLRQTDFQVSQLENFLRERMRHFEFDFTHERLFGDPPGHWPDLL